MYQLYEERKYNNMFSVVILKAFRRSKAFNYKIRVKPTCLRRRPKMRYMAISAQEAAFPVAPPGILATLMPCFVAALMSTPLYNNIIKYLGSWKL